MCLMLELLELILNFYSLGVITFFFKFKAQFVGNSFLLFTFFLIALFFPFFPQHECQFKKIWNQENMFKV
jgi:hypothetical protein